MFRLVRGGIQRSDFADFGYDMTTGGDWDKFGGAFDLGVEGLELRCVEGAEVGDRGAGGAAAVWGVVRG